MCGIIGIISNRPVAPLIMDGLKRLEYRGYDSAGIATLNAGEIDRLRAEGKLHNLETLLDQKPLDGTLGIGHTRWATHGAPTTNNAHPHVSDNVAVVHNGIIENFAELREELGKSGVIFETETDTEVIAPMVDHYLAQGKSPKQAVFETIRRLEGAYALAIMFRGEDDLIIGARRGSPLAVGHGSGEMYLGSDAYALAPLTDQVTFLEEGDQVVLCREAMEIFDESGNQVTRTRHTITASSAMVDKGNHRHFMAKEIFEQPEVVGHAIAEYTDALSKKFTLPEMPFELGKIPRITIIACGTAYYAAQIAKYWIEKLARISVEVDIASEFRYREAAMPEGGVALVISQSGETADTLAALRYCRAQGQHIGAVINVPESSIARESDFLLPTLAGPEIGVASTKAFACQMTVLYCFAVHLGLARGTVDKSVESDLVSALMEMPRHMAEILKESAAIEKIARHSLAHVKDALYIGRGLNHVIALEGALKLKELSYIHAEGYPAGELKHGPIALVDENMILVVIAPHDELFEKTMSNMQEVAARGGKIILITDKTGASHVTLDVHEQIILPDVAALLSPIAAVLPVQLLAYYTAVAMGTDVDQPRNLAKSVTVE